MTDRNVGTEPRAGECLFVGGTVAGDGGTDHAGPVGGGCPRPRCSGCPRERGRAAAVRDDLRGQRGALGRDAPAGAVGVPLVVPFGRRPWSLPPSLTLESTMIPGLDPTWRAVRLRSRGPKRRLKATCTASERGWPGKTGTANACHARSRAANVLSSSAASRTPRTVAPGVASAGVLSSVKPPPSRGVPPAPFRHRRRSRSPGGHRPA